MKLQFLSLTCLVLGLALGTAPAASLGTTINYQGRLTSNGNGANGQYDMRFRLYDDPMVGNQIGPTATVAPVQVNSGMFTAPLDFGSGVFDGTAYWLEIAVRPNGSASAYTVLTPRQPLNAVPHALWTINAGTASTANGVAINAVSASGIQNNTITAAKIASGQVVKSLNGLTDDVTLAAGTGITLTPSVGNTLTIGALGGGGWSLTGNSGTTPGVNFLGTVDNQPLELRAFGARALRLEAVERGDFMSSENSLNVLGGFTLNSISSGVLGGTVAGGGGSAFLLGMGFDFPNRVTGDYGTVGGGENNTAGPYGTVPGGSVNSAAGQYSFAAGHHAHANHDGAFVWSSYSRAASSFSTARFHVFAQNGFSVDYDAQRPDGGGSHWAGFGLFGGQTLSTWTGAFLEDNGDWHSRYVVAYGEGNEQAYLGGDGLGADVQIGSLNPAVANVAAYNPATGQYMNLIVRTLTITGGSDLAEPFQMSDREIPKGSVVIIDEARPGHLKMSTQAYDTRVAGVVSGANGVQPGIQMSQKGLLEGTESIALTGRVYVRADASHGAIQPGDLLTTSSTPGHAMKVTDHGRAQGAILGKAMSALGEGRGMVLVLVTLQ